jgi:hypothetical protein
VPAVAATRSAPWNELFAAKCQASVPAVAGDDVYVHFIDEHSGIW